VSDDEGGEGELDEFDADEVPVEVELVDEGDGEEAGIETGST